MVRDLVPSEVQINSSQPIKVICHGFSSDSSISWYKSMIQAYLHKDYSVISVDWEEHAYSSYFTAVNIASSVGELLASHLVKLLSEFSISLENVHIIGHSLGAHIAGFTGKYVYKYTYKKIGRITGLDPAGPLFNTVSTSQRLSKNDALFVDVLHTNARLFGISISIGHADFYPNGGHFQNSCILIGCSHTIAPVYFTESIVSNNFVSKYCNNFIRYRLGFCKNNVRAIMGENCQSNTLGDFYLFTNNIAPYGKG